MRNINPSTQFYGDQIEGGFKMRFRVFIAMFAMGTFFLSANACAKSVDADGEKKEVEKNVSVTIGDDSSTAAIRIIIDDDGDVKEYNLNGSDLENLGDLDEKLAQFFEKDLAGHFNFKMDGMNWNHAFLGVSVQKMTSQLRKFFKTDDDNGVLVAEVVTDSPAEKAGILAGDVIVKVGDNEIETPRDLTRGIGEYKPGSKVELKIIRNGKTKKMTATLAETTAHSFQTKMFPGAKGKTGQPKMMMFKSEDDKLQQQMAELKKQLDDLRNQLNELKEK